LLRPAGDRRERERGRELRGGRVREGRLRRVRPAQRRGARGERGPIRRARADQRRPLRPGLARAREAERAERGRRAAWRGRVPSVAHVMTRYTSATDQDRREMLARIGVGSIEDLFEAIPEKLRLKEPLNLPEGMSEQDVYEHLA